MANTNISLVGLDFDNIKNNLKNFLRNNPAFKDIDYEGSNINVLLDVLAYNTYMNSFYLNMIASEMFLDTAQLKDSIISHAKELNYLPRSYLSSNAKVNIEVETDGTIESVVIPKGYSFTSKVGSNTFSFVTSETIVLNSSVQNVFTANDVDIYEGVYLTDTFVMDYSFPRNRFVLSNPAVDVNSITLVSIEDNGLTTLGYTRETSLLNVTSNSAVFFVQAAENGQYEILFGNGATGRKPKDNSIIVAEYRISSGQLPNGANTFSPDAPIAGFSTIGVTTVSSATGGSVAESLEDIRFAAPRHFQAQERAITSNDYKILLQQRFPEIESLAVYGGEELSPPQFGRVFLSIDVANADGVSETDKDKYYNFIKEKCPLAIEPIFVNPDFLYVGVQTSVKYNAAITTKKQSDIASLVRGAISNYNTENVNGFDKTLRYSKLIAAIDQADPSIISNTTELRVSKRFTPITGTSFTVTFNFGMPIAIRFGGPLTHDYEGYYTHLSTDPEHSSPEGYHIHAVYSSSFYYRGRLVYFDDDGNGRMYMSNVGGDTPDEIRTEVGTVNYDTGEIKLTNIEVTEFNGAYISMFIVPRDNDISTSKNVILSISETDTSVEVIPIAVNK